jgi:hypothetical protein
MVQIELSLSAEQIQRCCGRIFHNDSAVTSHHILEDCGGSIVSRLSDAGGGRYYIRDCSRVAFQVARRALPQRRSIGQHMMCLGS